jgi:hypothetical protein
MFLERDKMHLFGKIIAGIFGGFIVAFLASNIATLVSKDTGTVILLVSWAVSIYIAVKSQRVARAWRWQLIMSGCLCFVLPLATLIFAARQEGAAEVVGGVVATGILGFVILPNNNGHLVKQLV